MRAFLKYIYKKLFFSPGERNYLLRELAIWKTEAFAPGHYYSSIPDFHEIEVNSANIFNLKNEIADIDVRQQSQYELLVRLVQFYKDIPFDNTKNEAHRYYFDNSFFCHSDGIFLYCLMRKFSPKRIIEIGSGFSSALMLDTNDLYFKGEIQLTFVEPYPEDRLLGLLRKGDNALLIKKKVQEIDIQIVESLERNDILFVDSSHVGKCGSDLNFILFNILPKLKSGVIIHFHDIFYPFEYPKEWVLSGRSWNEIYMLRAFLMNNLDYEIILFNSYVEMEYEEWFKENMPICLKLHERWPIGSDKGEFLSLKGQSIYIRKK